MDDRVRVEDAEIGLVSVLILITFLLTNLKTSNDFLILLNFEKSSQKLKGGFRMQLYLVS